MITVKLFGLLRVESGIKELQIEADTVKQVYQALLSQSTAIHPADLDGCVVLINGQKGTKKSKLHDGDTITLLSPVAGG